MSKGVGKQKSTVVLPCSTKASLMVKTILSVLLDFFSYVQDAFSKRDSAAITRKIMKVKSLKDGLMDQLLQIIYEECISLCGTRNPSFLRALTLTQLSSFSFRNIILEWESQAPLFTKFLYTVVSVHGSRQKENHIGICTAGAILLREQNIYTSAVHHIAGLIFSMEMLLKWYVIIYWYASDIAISYVCVIGSSSSKSYKDGCFT